DLAAARAWRPDVIVAQQWATAEADAWARALGTPLVMLVHGPGQYEAVAPVCDLVAFADQTTRNAAASALGATPNVVWTDPAALAAEVERVAAAGGAGGRRRPTLTLCMTVCNEDKTLEQAVASVAGVVDEIVIGVDRKSSDDTLAIARR